MSEHLINNHDCWQNYNNTRFKIIQPCSGMFDLMKMKPVLIHSSKPDLGKKKSLTIQTNAFCMHILFKKKKQ